MRYLKLLVLGLFLLPVYGHSQVSVVQLKTEDKINPIGMGELNPRFSWQIQSGAQGVMQTAYEIRVATDEKQLMRGKKLLWTSGKVASDQSVFVPYGGPELMTGQRYLWQVRVWDNQGNTSEWSPVNSWQMGQLKPSDWQAKWIGQGFPEGEGERPSPYFRKEFSATKSITSATAYVTSHGLYEAFINGHRVGDAYLTPGWTSYNKRLQYQAYDVTDLLMKGGNAIGVRLGNGWYRGIIGWASQDGFYGKELALLFQLEVTYSDGSRATIVSDGSWTSHTGGIVYAEIYNGETYDAGKEPIGWNMVGYDASQWKSAVVQDLSYDHLISTYNEPVRKHEEMQPINVMMTPEGDHVIDFGQNLVGWVRLKVNGNAGDTIRIYHAEVLDKEGNFYTANLRAAKQTNEFILKGGGEEILEPHFTFQGFRYIKVEGYPGELKRDNFTAIAMYSAMEKTGTFVTNDPLINQLQHNIQWGQQGNFLDVPTDCPQRDERLGWTGDAQAFSATAAFNRDVHNFFYKWLQDVAADQSSSGSVPFVVPNVLGENAGGSAGWADVATIIPWNMYLAYRDTRILENQYSSMKAWVGYMEKASTDDLWNKGFHFGDWLFYRPFDDNDGRSAVTDKYLIAQCFYAHSTQLLLNAAQVLGKTEDIPYYQNLLKRIKAAFMKEYVTGSGRLVSGTQTAYVLALQFDMLPENMRQQAVDRLVENIQSYSTHLTTGFLGTPYLCHVLSRFGHSDVAYALLMQQTYPSWLYPVTMGATTIWERWDGIKPDGTFQVPSMNSYNHYAYGAIGDWMYRNITGINEDPANPGYKHIILKPQPNDVLSYAQAELLTLFGKLASSWQIMDDTLELEVTIPANTTATLFIPKGEGMHETLDLGSGTYHYRVGWAGTKAGKFDLQSKVRDIWKDDAAKAVILKNIPELNDATDLQIGQMMDLSLGDLGKYAPDLFSEARLKMIEEAFRKL